MTNLSEIHTVKTAPARCLAPVKPFERPALSFAQQAKRDNRAVLASWDRAGNKFAGSKESVAANRLAWLEALPDGPFDRHAARAVWGIADGAADNRIDTLERNGMLKRLPVRPYQWERAE